MALLAGVSEEQLAHVYRARLRLNPGAAELVLACKAAGLKVLLVSGPIGYDQWAGIFSSQWMKVLTFAVIVALIWHAWVGMRNVWMDYGKPMGVRLTLEVLTIIWLIGCAGWAFQVLWRL